MSDLVQHIVALTIVAGCLGYVGWQGVQTFRGKRSRVGSCCARGCDPQRQGGDAATPTAKAPQIVYIPVDMLGRGRKR
jgi:hypothetical protein